MTCNWTTLFCPESYYLAFSTYYPIPRWRSRPTSWQLVSLSAGISPSPLTGGYNLSKPTEFLGQRRPFPSAEVSPSSSNKGNFLSLPYLLSLNTRYLSSTIRGTNVSINLSTIIHITHPTTLATNHVFNLVRQTMRKVWPDGRMEQLDSLGKVQWKRKQLPNHMHWEQWGKRSSR